MFHSQLISILFSFHWFMTFTLWFDLYHSDFGFRPSCSAHGFRISFFTLNSSDYWPSGPVVRSDPQVSVPNFFWSAIRSPHILALRKGLLRRPVICSGTTSASTLSLHHSVFARWFTYGTVSTGNGFRTELSRLVMVLAQNYLNQRWCSHRRVIWSSDDSHREQSQPATILTQHYLSWLWARGLHGDLHQFFGFRSLLLSVSQSH